MTSVPVTSSEVSNLLTCTLTVGTAISVYVSFQEIHFPTVFSYFVLDGGGILMCKFLLFSPPAPKPASARLQDAEEMCGRPRSHQ